MSMMALGQMLAHLGRPRPMLGYGGGGMGKHRPRQQIGIPWMPSYGFGSPVAGTQTATGPYGNVPTGLGGYTAGGGAQPWGGGGGGAPFGSALGGYLGGLGGGGGGGGWGGGPGLLGGGGLAGLGSIGRGF